MDWKPISELTDKYNVHKFLLASPKLIDMDFNEEGVAEGYWQDDEGWKVVGWDSCNDEYNTLTLSESDVTHFIVVKGPYDICHDDGCDHYGMIHVCNHPK